jgi:hypothetical protein
MRVPFDWSTGAFSGIDDDARSQVLARPDLESRLRHATRLAEGGGRERARSVLACAANLAATVVDRRVVIRRLAREALDDGRPADAWELCEVALGRRAPPLGPALRAHVVERAQALAFDARAAALLPELEQAVEELHACGDARATYAAHLAILRLTEDASFDRATELALVELAERALAKDGWGEALAWSDLGAVERARGRLNSALLSMDRACACLARAPGLDPRAAGWVYLRHATVASDAGKLRDALVSVERAVAVVDPELRGDARLLEAQLCCELGLRRRGQRLLAGLLRDALAGALPREFRHAAMAIVCALAIRRGGPGALEASVLLHEELDRLGESNLHVAVPRPFAVPAASSAAPLDEALARTEERIAHARRRRMRHKLSEASLERARLLVGAGLKAAAIRALEDAERCAHQANSFGDELEVELLRARLLALHAGPSLARARLIAMLERIAAREDRARWTSLAVEAALEAVEIAVRTDEPDALDELLRLRARLSSERSLLVRYDLERRMARAFRARGADREAAYAAQAAASAGARLCAAPAAGLSDLLAEVLREDAAWAASEGLSPEPAAPRAAHA